MNHYDIHIGDTYDTKHGRGNVLLKRTYLNKWEILVNITSPLPLGERWVTTREVLRKV